MFKGEKRNISWHVSKQRMSPSCHQRLQPPWVIAATLEGEPLSPEGTQEGRKDYLPSSSHQTAATPQGEPQGGSGGEKHRILTPR